MKYKNYWNKGRRDETVSTNGGSSSSSQNASTASSDQDGQQPMSQRRRPSSWKGGRLVSLDGIDLHATTMATTTTASDQQSVEVAGVIDRNGNGSSSSSSREPLTPEIVFDIIHAFQNGSKLGKDSLITAIDAVTELLQKEPTLLDYRQEPRTSKTEQPPSTRRNVEQITVVGDLHGSLPSLSKILNMVSFDDPNKIVIFDGYVFI